MEPAPRQVAVKVSPEGDRLITSGAHYLHMSKKDLVEAAVEFYLNARREEMQAGMRELLGQLDGSRAARVAAHTPPLATSTYTGDLLPGEEDELRWRAEHAVRTERRLQATRVAAAIANAVLASAD